MANSNELDMAKEKARRKAINTAFIFGEGHICDGYGRRDCYDCAESSLRIRMEPDDVCDMEDLKGDCFNPRVNDDIDPDVLAEQERDFEDAVRQYGVWCLLAEYKDEDGEWTTCDSICGLCDEDAVSLYTAEFQERLMALDEPTPDSWCAL